MTPASTNPLLAGQHSGHPILLRTYHRKTKRPWERNLSSSTVAIKEKVCNRVSWPPVPVRYRGGLYIAGARENTRHFHGRDHIQWSSTKAAPSSASFQNEDPGSGRIQEDPGGSRIQDPEGSRRIQDPKKTRGGSMQMQGGSMQMQGGSMPPTSPPPPIVMDKTQFGWGLKEDTGQKVEGKGTW